MSVEWYRMLKNLQQVAPGENMALLTAWILPLETCVRERTRPESLDTWVFYLACVLRRVISLLWDPVYLAGIPAPQPLPG